MTFLRKKKKMENEKVFFADLPDKEYTERVGNAIDQMVKQGEFGETSILDDDILAMKIADAIELAEAIYNEEKGYN